MSGKQYSVNEPDGKSRREFLRQAIIGTVGFAQFCVLGKPLGASVRSDEDIILGGCQEDCQQHPENDQCESIPGTDVCTAPGSDYCNPNRGDLDVCQGICGDEDECNTQLGDEDLVPDPPACSDPHGCDVPGSGMDFCLENDPDICHPSDHGSPDVCSPSGPPNDKDECLPELGDTDNPPGTCGEQDWPECACGPEDHEDGLPECICGPEDQEDLPP